MVAATIRHLHLLDGVPKQEMVPAVAWTIVATVGYSGVSDARRTSIRTGSPAAAGRRGRVAAAPEISSHGLARRATALPPLRAGAAFVRWITLHGQCAACGLVYLRNQGDIWFFWVVMDRIPILLGVAAIFFGFRITNWLNGVGFFLAIAGPLIVTMPQRQGAAVALKYLSRVYFRDPSDALPDAVDS